MVPIIKISDKLLELKSNSKAVSKGDILDFLQPSSDSLALLGHSITEVNIKYHELIQPDLNDQFKQLCSAQTPVTKMLIGDDLPKSVTEISETKKVEKSVLVPSQYINLMGFTLNSVEMKVSLTPTKATKIKLKAVGLYHNLSPTVSEVIGLMVASFPGVRDKVKTLKQNKANFKAIMTLSDMARSDL
ncbi:unnamed protein product, partial [Pocillopora meandrina]